LFFPSLVEEWLFGKILNDDNLMTLGFKMVN
jgi:hypothetical protein